MGIFYLTHEKGSKHIHIEKVRERRKKEGEFFGGLMECSGEPWRGSKIND